MIAVMAKPLDWQALLVDGYEPLKRAQRIFRPPGARSECVEVRGRDEPVDVRVLTGA